MDEVDQMYQEHILDHYKNPRNKGRIENASVHHHEKNPLCGDTLDVYMIIKNDKVEDVKIDGHGCAISQAAASMLSEKVKGKNILEIKSLKKDDILSMLGIPISAARLKCALLSMDTFKNGIVIHEKYVSKGG